MRGYNEDPFVYLDEEEEDGAFAEIKEYFGLEVSDDSNEGLVYPTTYT